MVEEAEEQGVGVEVIERKGIYRIPNESIERCVAAGFLHGVKDEFLCEMGEKLHRELREKLMWFVVKCGLGYIVLTAVVSMLFSGCIEKDDPSTAVSTPPAQVAPLEKSKDIVYLQDGQTLELLEDVVVKGRIPFSGDELYTGEVRIKAGSMIVKPKAEGPVQSTPLVPQEMPMTREEKVKRFQMTTTSKEH